MSNGLLEITDPTQAYLQLGVDGSSSYLRLDPLQHEPTVTGKAGYKYLQAFHVRVDGDGSVGTQEPVSLQVPRSLYLYTTARHTVRVWLVEAKGTMIPLSAVRPNVRVRFSVQWLRVGTMVVIAFLFALWRPRSKFWRITLDTSNRGQRIAFGAFMLTLTAMTAMYMAHIMRYAGPLAFHRAGNYTYDFDQYGHVADALLHGRTWLDLPMPPELAQASNPYSTAVRERMLAQGVSPIYWDYAFYHGHWYSYFGVLPAVLLFAPYRLLSSLWASGGQMLPAGVAVLIMLLGFLLFGFLLIIRLACRVAPKTSISAISMAFVLLVIGSNAEYLWFRTNFYSVPFSASLLLTALGLWLWMGAAGHSQGSARRPAANPILEPAERPLKRHKRWAVEGAPPLSLPHLAAGSLCIAANFGCRQPFTLVALLGIPLFWPQIKALCRGVAHRAVGLGHALHVILAVAVPALLIVTPLAAYNVVRFGSPGNYGNNYQLTVTDMVNYTLPLRNFAQTIGYYLLLPLRFVGRFPFLALSPTPMDSWSYVEPMVGGFLVLCPFALLALALPFLRRRLKASGYWGVLMTCLALGVFLLVFDTLIGGLGWRYMIDFGWLIMLAAITVLLLMLQRRAPDADQSDTPELETQTTGRVGWRLWCLRAVVLAVLSASIAVAMQSLFVIGRFDNWIAGNPWVFYNVKAWFLPLT